MKDELVVRRKTRRPRRLTARRPPTLYIARILQWADAWFERTGDWPTRGSGHIPGTIDEKWSSIDNALRVGARGLPGASSLARLLAERRGRRNRKQLPPYTTAQILAWADAHHARTGRWPNSHLGPIPEAPGETWTAVDIALSHGQRGLPGGSTLARLLVRRRGVRNRSMLPRLSIDQILAWADAHYRRTGNWPKIESGPIADAPGETWLAVNHALRRGVRRLPGGSSLARLLAKHRGVLKQHRRLPPLTIEQILGWADAHYRRTGQWPRATSGRIPGAPGESWLKIDRALQKGQRRLSGGATLVRLLAEYRGLRNIHGLPDLSIEQIKAWCRAHYARTGCWPTKSSGSIAGTGETWSGVNFALRQGNRGLPPKTSLARLLAEHCGVRNRAAIGSFTFKQILAFADAHFERTGSWPNTVAGPVAEMPWITWRKIDDWLRTGLRGLKGGGTLCLLLQAHGRLAPPWKRQRVPR